MRARVLVLLLPLLTTAGDAGATSRRGKAPRARGDRAQRAQRTRRISRLREYFRQLRESPRPRRLSVGLTWKERATSPAGESIETTHRVTGQVRGHVGYVVESEKITTKIVDGVRKRTTTLVRAIVRDEAGDAAADDGR